MDPLNQTLMACNRGRGHIMFPVDDLVPPPIVWEQLEVVVR